MVSIVELPREDGLPPPAAAASASPGPSPRPGLQGGTITPSASSAFTAVLPSNQGGGIGPRPNNGASPLGFFPSPASGVRPTLQTPDTQPPTSAYPVQGPTASGLAAGGTSLTAPPARPRATGSNARRPNSSNNNNSSAKKHCNCKNSKCLKLYCECFAGANYCQDCNCVGCQNNKANEAVRQVAVSQILERNPNAFRPKIQATDDGVTVATVTGRHNKGCNCKKSGCLKKYCECFQASIFCSDICKCVECKNYHGSDAREVVLRIGASAAAAAVKQAESKGMPPIDLLGIPHNGSTLAPSSAPSGPLDKKRRLNPPGTALTSGTGDIVASTANGLAPSRAMPIAGYGPSGISGPSPGAGYASLPQNGQYMAQDLNQASAAETNPSMRVLQEQMRTMLKTGGVEGLLSILLMATQAEERMAVERQAQQMAQHSQAQAQAQASYDAANQQAMVSQFLQNAAAGQAGDDYSPMYEAKERCLIYEQLKVLKKILDHLAETQAHHQAVPMSQPQQAGPYVSNSQVDHLRQSMGQGYHTLHQQRQLPSYNAPLPDAQIVADMQSYQQRYHAQPVASSAVQQTLQHLQNGGGMYSHAAAPPPPQPLSMAYVPGALGAQMVAPRPSWASFQPPVEAAQMHPSMQAMSGLLQTFQQPQQPMPPALQYNGPSGAGLQPARPYNMAQPVVGPMQGLSTPDGVGAEAAAAGAGY